jgi:hypothetical protein
MWILIVVVALVALFMAGRALLKLVHNPRLRDPGNCSICGRPNNGDHDECRLEMSAW